MQTTSIQVPAARRVSVQCVLYLPHDERHGSGTIHTLFMDRCHIESSVEVCPGMIVSLYLMLPNAPQDIPVVPRRWCWSARGGMEHQWL